MLEQVPATVAALADPAATGEAHRVVRRRFDLLTGALALDREQAAGWTLGRLLQYSLRAVVGPSPPPALPLLSHPAPAS